jgi:hypothetical protein
MRLRTWAFAVAICATGCTGGEVYKSFAHDTRHLDNGDSVEIQASMPVTESNGTRGRLVVFFPYRTLYDSVRLRETALALFRHLAPGLDSAPPPFVVLRAVNLPSEKRGAVVYRLEYFGFVFERDKGTWLLDGAPVRAH